MTFRRMLALTATAATLAALTSPALAISAYKWKKRPLVVFAASEGDPALARQRGIVAALRPAFQDRQMVVVYVVDDKVGAELGTGPGVSAAALRARFGVAASAFRVLLVGKDGGVKLSSAAPIPGTTLFSTIDAMPMRQQETQKR